MVHDILYWKGYGHRGHPHGPTARLDHIASEPGRLTGAATRTIHTLLSLAQEWTRQAGFYASASETGLRAL